ncbi:MAG: transposase, partial [Nitrospirota bacterium]|nr:transposase [Nitrospirota bacterium]
RRLKEKFPHYLAKVYWDGGGVWARGFFASTVGVNEATIRQYVRYQGEPLGRSDNAMMSFCY